MRGVNYYAVFDNQLGQILNLGFNSISLSEIRDLLIAFLLKGNFSEEGEFSIQENSLEELLNYYGFELLY